MSFDDLPKDLLLSILIRTDVSLISILCRKFYDMVKKNEFWLTKLSHDYNVFKIGKEFETNDLKIIYDEFGYIIWKNNYVITNEEPNYFQLCYSHIYRHVNHKDKDAMVVFAAYYGDMNLIRLFTERGRYLFYAGEFPMRAAISKGNLEVVKYLTEKGSDIHIWNEYPLRFACRKGKLDIVKYFVSQGCNIYASGPSDPSALTWAQEKGRTEVIDYLKSLMNN